MPLPAAVFPKLRKLLPGLSSDKAGEVVATAGAIARTLKAVGATWHDLTAQLTELPDDVLDHPELTDWEYDFVELVYGQFRCRRRQSERQLEVLERIWRKIEEGAA